MNRIPQKDLVTLLASMGFEIAPNGVVMGKNYTEVMVENMVGLCDHICDYAFEQGFRAGVKSGVKPKQLASMDKHS